MHSSNWFKISRAIVTSSINDEAVHVRWLFLCMLEEAQNPVNPNRGFCIMSDSALRRRANLTDEQFADAIDVLSRPDPASRTPDNSGRRIERVQGGWRILNFRLYHSDPELSAKRSEAGKRGAESRWKNGKQQVLEDTCMAKSANVQTETETETERDTQESPDGDSVSAKADEAETVAERFIKVFNAAFDRKVSATPALVDAVKQRLTGRVRVASKSAKIPEVKAWFLAVMPALFRAGCTEAFARGVSPSVLLRSGLNPKTTSKGYTSGATDHIARTMEKLDTTRLDRKLSGVVRAASEAWPEYGDVATKLAKAGVTFDADEGRDEL